MTAVIETEGLTKFYGSARGIEDVDLAVREGEVFGFLGPNGAGKTTMIRTLMSFLRPSRGRAAVFGLDTRRQAVAVHARVGNLPGDFTYDGDMTGRRLLRLFARLRGLEGLGQAGALAERLHADLDRPLRELSRGNRRKIGLVQAMFHRPPLLILDEPTGGLDPLMQEAFLDLCREVRAEGRTVFLSSHNLAEVERVCDRVGIIRAGRLVAVETVEGLTEKSFRHVRLTFDGPAEGAAFAALPGVTDLTTDGATVSFVARGGLDAVVKLAARQRVVDLEVEHPSLEEAFLTFYGGNEEPK